MSGFLGRRFWLVAVVVYVVATIVWLAPTSLAPWHRLLEGRNDATLTLTQWRGEREAGTNPFTANVNTLIGAPEGVPLARSVNWLSPFEPAFDWTLRYIFGWVGVFNLYLATGLVASALAAALLFRRLALAPEVALFGGYVFAFNPWMMAHARLGDDSFDQMWILPLLLLAALGMSRRRTLLSGFLVGLCVGVGYLIYPYVGLLAGFVAVIYFAYEIIRVRGLDERLWTATLGTAFAAGAFLCLIPGLFAWYHDRSVVFAIYNRASADRQTYAMDTWSYFLPSPANPALGWITTRFADPASAESIATIGLSGLVLACLGAWWVFRRRSAATTIDQRRIAVIAVALAVFGYWASLQRLNHLGPVTVPGMSFFFEHVTTYYRVYARFAAVTLLGLTVLMVIALNRLRARRVWFLVAIGLVLLETFPGFATSFDTRKGPAYAEWLGKQPLGIEAVYPAMTDEVGVTKVAIDAYLDQFFAHQPLYSSYSAEVPGTRSEAIRILSRYLSNSQTWSVLRAENVRYVVVREDVYRLNHEKVPRHLRGLVLLKRFGSIAIYRLSDAVAPADLDTLLAQDRASIAATEGVQAPDVTIDGAQSGTVATNSTIEITPRDNLLDWVQVSVTLQNASAPELLALFGQGGNVVAQAMVPTGSNLITLGPVEVSSSAPTRLRVEITHRTPFTEVGGTPLANLAPVTGQG